MRKIFLIFIPILLFGNFKELIRSIDHSKRLKAIYYKSLSAKYEYLSQKGDRYPKIDLNIRALFLKESPKSTLYIPNLPPLDITLASKREYQLIISFQYPLFAGFKIENLIDIKRYQKEIASLKIASSKRELYLNGLKLYIEILKAKETLKALKEAKRAIDISYKKAKRMFELKLKSSVDLYKFRAKSYEIEANLKKLKNYIKILKKNLTYISNYEGDVFNISFKKLPSLNTLKRYAIKNRSDLLILKEILQINKKEIAIAKGEFLPTITLIGAIKKRGDSLEFNGDRYRNGDESYIGVDIRANLFNGFKDRYKIEAKRYKMLSNFHKYIDYKELIFKNISNQKLLINEIKSSLISKKESLKAAKKYLELIKKSYDNGLIDSETLSNAISNYALYLSEYKKEKLELIFQIGKSWLLSGIVPFKRAIKR